MTSVISRLVSLERSFKRNDDVFILELQGGGAELLRTGKRFMRRFFQNEEEAVKTIPNDSVLIVDDL